MDKVWEVRWESYKLSRNDPRGVVTYIPGHLSAEEASLVLEGISSILHFNISEGFRAATGEHHPFPVEKTSETHIRCGHSPWLEADLIEINAAQWQQDRRPTTFTEVVAL